MSFHYQTLSIFPKSFPFNLPQSLPINNSAILKTTLLLLLSSNIPNSFPTKFGHILNY